MHCHLCAHRCLVAGEKRSACQVQENQARTLCTLVYGQMIARYAALVGKKPLLI
jgi:pyruvate formate lyase activating enzyme